MHRIAAVATLALIAGLAGCSGGAQSGESGATAGANAEPSETTAPETSTPAPEATTTTAQWASQIAPLKAKFEETEKDWEDSGCSVTAANDDVLCQAKLTIMSMDAQTIQISTESLTMPQATSYLGDPPSEIESLYTKTLEAANMAVADGKAVSCPGDDCVTTAFTFERSWDALGDALTMWEPYL